MNHSEKIKDILSEINPGLPILKVRLSSNKISLRNSEIGDWNPNVNGDSFHENLVKQFAKRKMTNCYPDKGYAVDVETTLRDINNYVINESLPLYSSVCFNSNPRRTKLYKQISFMLKKAGRDQNDSLLNFLFDVNQYAQSVSKDIPITHQDNIVHRKNILKLFEIMEQKHGSKPINK